MTKKPFLEAAFVGASRVLRHLVGLGAYVPSIELFVDGSCTLHLRGAVGSTSMEDLRQVASGMLCSSRWEKVDDEWRLSSCAGLFTRVGKGDRNPEEEAVWG